MRASIFSLLMVLVISGCWNKEYNEPGRIEIERQDTEMTINASFARVWAATQTTLAKFSMLRKDGDDATAKGYIVTDWTRGKSDILYHGYDVNRIPYVIRYKLFVYVTGLNGMARTKVQIKSIEQYLDDAITSGVDFQGGVYNWIRTESSSLKENALLQQIQRLAMDPQFKVEN